jgi:hypothetical protein
MAGKRALQSLSPSQAAAAAAAKRARVAEAKVKARQEGWRLVNKELEVFFPQSDELPTTEQFLEFNIRGSRNPSRFDIFRRFVTTELLEKVKARWTAANLMIGGIQKTSGNPKLMKPTLRYMWQALAIEIRLIGLQDKVAEGDAIKNPLLTFVKN